MNVAVKKSKIRGEGLFAVQDIPWGTRVLQYTGEVISDEEATRRLRAGADAIFELDNGMNIDGRIGGSGAEYANHCREKANSFILRENDEIWIVAGIEGISAGEEITYDYGSDYYPQP